MHTNAESRPGWREVYFNPQTAVFWGVHLAAIAGVVALGWSWTGLALALALYAPRMFFVTAGNHRYFSHRSYRTSRAFQFVLAIGAVATGQKGVIWWASHHRRHHRLSDRPGDIHSPREGFWWSHMGWMLSRDQDGTDLSSVKDLTRFPELRWLERFWMVPPVAAGVLTWAVGGVFGAGLGRARLAGAVLARNVHHQLAVAPDRQPALCHPGRLAQPLAAGAADLRRGLAQQPPPPPGPRPPGPALVGDRRHLLHPAAAGGGGPGLGSPGTLRPGSCAGRAERAGGPEQPLRVA